MALHAISNPNHMDLIRDRSRLLLIPPLPSLFALLSPSHGSLKFHPWPSRDAPILLWVELVTAMLLFFFFLFFLTESLRCYTSRGVSLYVVLLRFLFVLRFFIYPTALVRSWTATQRLRYPQNTRFCSTIFVIVELPPSTRRDPQDEILGICPSRIFRSLRQLPYC
ncbi:hypothetical protein F4804DRAFT_316660 [Jackrogersella minutella]|nr:hypothetical protein F4804DRAFT_316660 [Jackrogersella minutella]